MQVRIESFLLLTALCFGAGCRSTAFRRPLTVQEVSTHLTSIDAIRIAESTAKGVGLNLTEFERNPPRYNPFREEWTVGFDGNALEPGGFFSVVIDDHTGEAQLLRGM